MYVMNGKKIQDIGFSAGDVNYPPGWMARATPAELEALGIAVVADPVRPDARLGEVNENLDGSFTLEPHPLEVVIANACNAIDDTVSAVYTKWTRFQKEYDARLQAAEAYAQAGYTGPVSVYISSVADAAGISAQAAADQVIEQATMFEVALEQLGAARMRKFEVKRATDAAGALALQDAIISQINTIAAQIS